MADSEWDGISANAIRGLLDREAIRSVLNRYSRGVDRCDEDLAASVYHEDAFDDHGAFKGLGQDFARSPFRKDPTWKCAHHGICQSEIDLQGDVAFAETYYIYHYHRMDHRRKEERSGSMIGRYLDKFERRDGEWKIAFRRVILDYSHDHPVGDQWPGADRFFQGKRSHEDEVYHPERLVTPEQPQQAD